MGRIEIASNARSIKQVRSCAPYLARYLSSLALENVHIRKNPCLGMLELSMCFLIISTVALAVFPLVNIEASELVKPLIDARPHPCNPIALLAA